MTRKSSQGIFVFHLVRSHKNKDKNSRWSVNRLVTRFEDFKRQVSPKGIREQHVESTSRAMGDGMSDGMSQDEDKVMSLTEGINGSNLKLMFEL